MIKKENRAEFIGQVIDIFEDFLDEKGIIIPNTERDTDPDYNPEESANVYGSDYGFIQEELEGLFINRKVLEDERPLIDYQFKVSINGARCEGSVSVKAVDPDDTRKHRRKSLTGSAGLFQNWISNIRLNQWKAKAIQSTVSHLSGTISMPWQQPQKRLIFKGRENFSRC